MTRKILLLIFSFFIFESSSFAFDFSFSKKRDYIYIVGSSTISPFMSAVSEEFSRNAHLSKSPTKTPIIEPNGSLEGFKMFCGGIGYEYPDVTGASRRIEKSELDNCRKNGVKEASEIKIGYDGIIFGNFIGNKKINFTQEQIFLALAEKVFDVKSGKIILNPYKKWSDIDPKLPKIEITIYGPPSTSGTRDVFADLVMEKICLQKEQFVKSYKDFYAAKNQCRKIRRDGRFIESGENDNFIVENLKSNHNSFGIFGFNFLFTNRNKIQAAKVDGVIPTYENISSKKYPLSRPLFVYFKKDHLKLMPQMRDFIKEMISAETIGKNGYLVNNGLIALSDSELSEVRQNILSQIE